MITTIDNNEHSFARSLNDYIKIRIDELINNRIDHLNQDFSDIFF
jgi:hypothetical protein